MGFFNDTECAAIPLPGVVEKPYGLYPGLKAFSKEYDAEDYRDWVEQSNGDPLPAPLALYIQDTGPAVMGGTHLSTSHRLSAIEQEIALQGALFDSDRPLQQFICSGNIATEWTDDQLYRLVSVVQEFFLINQRGLSSWCACAGHVILPEARLRLLRILGFSSIRFSLGSQVAKSATLDELGAAIEAGRRLGIQKATLDIVLDDQLDAMATADALEQFLSGVIPDRVRLMGEDNDQHKRYVATLSSLGYQNIGLDWFLRADDIWLQAKSAGLLHWSLLGFTAMQSPDVIGVGPGAISSVGDFYGLNECRWQAYQESLGGGRLPVISGIELEADDVLRREIMHKILANNCLRISAIEEKWGIRFKQFFDYEVEQLMAFQQLGWIDWDADRISIRVQGFQELTKICRVFDHRERARLAPPSLSLV